MKTEPTLPTRVLTPGQGLSTLGLIEPTETQLRDHEECQRWLFPKDGDEEEPSYFPFKEERLPSALGEQNPLHNLIGVYRLSVSEFLGNFNVRGLSSAQACACEHLLTKRFGAPVNAMGISRWEIPALSLQEWYTIFAFLFFERPAVKVDDQHTWLDRYAKMMYESRTGIDLLASEVNSAMTADVR